MTAAAAAGEGVYSEEEEVSVKNHFNIDNILSILKQEDRPTV